MFVSVPGPLKTYSAPELLLQEECALKSAGYVSCLLLTHISYFELYFQNTFRSTSYYILVNWIGSRWHY